MKRPQETYCSVALRFALHASHFTLHDAGSAAHAGVSPLAKKGSCHVVFGNHPEGGP
ncbi:MAG TPA: hypothetical protein VJO34_04965 [Methylomirabilota bacterium]|nr:hypothetical protein [Methylomirabilota bacterium]